MTKSTLNKRKYDSSRRQMQAQETRRQIAESARSLFIESGYDGTTIDAIAQKAGVASETVYSIFNSKRKILWYLMDVSVGSDEKPIRLMDRPEPQAVLHDTDPVRQIRMFSRGITDILIRVAPIFEVLRSAAKTDKEISELVQKLLRERLENLTTFVQHLANNTALREGLDFNFAGELVWTITSPEVFLLLTRDRGYSTEHYSDWLFVNLRRLLLP
jgi:AcrR family transcriptional regulator